MPQIRNIRRVNLVSVFFAVLACAPLANADDMASFATGGYARGLRTMSEMHKIDTDGDGSISKAEWLAYQEKVFAALDKNKTGVVDENPSERRVSPGPARRRMCPRSLRRAESGDQGQVHAICTARGSPISIDDESPTVQAQRRSALAKQR